MSEDFFDYKLIANINPDLKDNYFTVVLDEYLASYYQNDNQLDVLDIGCGNGKFSIALKNKVKHCTLVGVDSNKRALKDALDNGFDMVHHTFDFSNDTVSIEQKFDLIICKDVLEHILFPDNLAKNFSSLLKDDGHIIIAVPNHFSFYGRLKFLLTNNIDPWKYFPENNRWNFPHIRFFTVSDLCCMMSISGFKVQHNFCQYFPSFIGARFFPKKILKSLASKYPDQFSEALVYMFKKL